MVWFFAVDSSDFEIQYKSCKQNDKNETSVDEHVYDILSPVASCTKALIQIHIIT